MVLADRANHGKPVEWTKRFAGHIYGVHYKDFLFEKTAMVDTIVGQGNLDLPAFIAGLDAAKFDGMAVIEYEADVDNPVPAAEALRRGDAQFGLSRVPSIHTTSDMNAPVSVS